MVIYVRDFTEVFEKAASVTVIKDGVKTQYVCTSEQFDRILKALKKGIANSRLMPAFGVSLQDETLSAMTAGEWVEFDFQKRVDEFEMPFERLLIEVVPDYAGINIIRFTKEYGYTGRCFHLDLCGGNLSELYGIIKNGL